MNIMMANCPRRRTATAATYQGIRTALQARKTPHSRANIPTNVITYAAMVRKRHLVEDLNGDILNNAGVSRILEAPTSAVNAGAIQHRETPMRSHF